MTLCWKSLKEAIFCLNKRLSENWLGNEMMINIKTQVVNRQFHMWGQQVPEEQISDL